MDIGGHSPNPIFPSSYENPVRMTPEESVNQFQVDPATAMLRSQRSSLTPLIYAAGTLALLLFLTVTGLSNVNKRQRVSVGAGFDLKKSLRGTIQMVTPATKSFIVDFRDTQDPAIASAGHTSWNIQLGPGDTTVCATANLDGPLTDATPADCIEVLIPGTQVLVEYVVIKPEQATLIAKTIITAK